MKRKILIAVILLSSITVFAQSAANRKQVADNMEILMKAQGFDIEFNAMGEGNYLFQIDHKELTTVLEVYTFLITSGEEVWDILFANDVGFIYICFKQIDKCYTQKEIKHFFTL
jgi:hypothetical protein